MKALLGFVLGLFLMNGIISCSKKEVVQDEPLINPSGEAEPGTATPADAVTATEATPVAETPAPTDQMQTVYFEFDSYRVTGSGRDAANQNAQWLKDNPSVSVQIEGHCDERGTTEYNLALGERRANAVRDYMVKQGISRSRISVISYGEERALESGHDEAAWAKNRRAQFVITSK